jgi:hypothetical protein
MDDNMFEAEDSSIKWRCPEPGCEKVTAPRGRYMHVKAHTTRKEAAAAAAVAAVAAAGVMSALKTVKVLVQPIASPTARIKPSPQEFLLEAGDSGSFCPSKLLGLVEAFKNSTPDSIFACSSTSSLKYLTKVDNQRVLVNVEGPADFTSRIYAQISGNNCSKDSSGMPLVLFHVESSSQAAAAAATAGKHAKLRRQQQLPQQKQRQQQFHHLHQRQQPPMLLQSPKQLVGASICLVCFICFMFAVSLWEKKAQHA